MGRKKREIPLYDMGLIETHCHLDYLKDLTTEEIIKKSSDLNIEKIITIAVDPGNLKSVRDLVTKHDNVYGTQGVHPHDAKDFNSSVKQEIEDHINDSKIVAVGEIGLDYHYNNSPVKEQRQAFEQQLQIAVDHNKPVVIHTRDADDDTIDILKNFTNSLKGNGVIHSFTSSLDLAQFCLNEGFHLGFNGIITFKKAENVREVLKNTPLERILLETDSPFLTPDPYRGRENAPYYLPFIAEKVAEVLEINIDQVLQQTKLNSLNLFKLW